MTLIKSISGIRGTIGGKENQSLTPIDTVKYVSAFFEIMSENGNKKIVVGRDGRVTGLALKNLVINTLILCGVEVIDLDLATTPSVEMAVVYYKAAGGIIITASHNPMEWNALKLLNDKGEFISDEIGKKLLNKSEKGDVSFANIHQLGHVVEDKDYLNIHIQNILKHPLVNKEAIGNKDFKIVVDGINSVGSFAVPRLLNALGIRDENITVLNSDINGVFAHNPEPLKENLEEIISKLKMENLI